MRFDLRRLAVTSCLVLAVSAPLTAQREAWTRPFPGHRVIGNLYAVGTYDLAVFISEAFSPEARRREEMDLLRLYHSVLVENGVRGYSYDQCLLDYRFSMLDMFLFWIVLGGYCDFDGERATQYLHNTMERFNAAIADLGSADLLSG